MKIVGEQVGFLSVAFVVCLVGAHLQRGGWDALGLELCFFREGESWLLGYAMFGLLAWMGAMLVWRLANNPNEAVNYDICSSVLVLLVVVATTDARNPFHILASLVVIGGLFVCYASMLNEWDHPWRRAHWAMPIALLMLPPMGSFGSWQKGMILYLVALMNAHYRSLAPPKATASRREPRHKRRRKKRLGAGSVFVPAIGARSAVTACASPRVRSSSHG